MQYLISQLVTFLMVPVCYAESRGINSDASSVNANFYDLHHILFYICCVGSVLIFSVLLYALIRFRKSTAIKMTHFHQNLAIDLLWAIIPIVITILLALPAILSFIKS